MHIFNRPILLLFFFFMGLAHADTMFRATASASIDGTSIPPATQIVDAQGGVWTLQGGVVYKNGATAGYSASVTLLVWENSQIYQSNQSGGWWSWNGSSWVDASDPRTPATSTASTGTPIQAPLASAGKGTWQSGDISVAGVTLHSGKPFHYNFLLPEGYSSAHTYPILVYEHENTEGNNWYQGGGGTIVNQNVIDGTFNDPNFRKAYPAIVLVPYADQTDNTGGVGENFGGYNDSPGSEANERAVVGMVQYFISHYSVDATRIYATGDSLGGIGTEALMLDYNTVNGVVAKVFTAGLPYAGQIYRQGEVSQATINRMASVPVFAVSGKNDTTSPVEAYNRPMWRGLAGNSNYPGPMGRQAGSSKYLYLEDPNLGHDVWDTYRTLPGGKTMYDWLFAQKSGGGTVVQPSASTAPVQISASGTTIPSATQIVDAQSHVWTVVGGVVSIDGKTAGYSANVTTLLYYKTSIYQSNGSGWWVWNGSSWDTSSDPRPTPTPSPSPSPTPTKGASASGTTIPGASQIVDAQTHVWTVVGGVVSIDGKTAGYSANVTTLLYDGGQIFQSNGSGWWVWNGSGWDTSSDPRPAKPSPSPTNGISASGTTIPNATQIVDAQTHVWTIVGGVVYIDGTTAGYSASVTTLLYYKTSIYQSNGSGWWEWNGSGWDDSSDPRVVTTVPSTGAFSVKNGQIYDPNGKIFIARGLNMGPQNMADAAKNAQAQPMTTLFPGINFVRVADGGLTGDPSRYAAFIQQATANGIVVEIEDHPWPMPNPFSGSTLSTEAAKYASLAAAFKSNPYVWFGTQNEPQSNSGIQTMQSTIVNAVRNAGSNTIVMMTPMGGGNPGQQGPNAGLDPSVYAKLSNVVWDLHVYGWIVPNKSTDASVILNAIMGSVSAASGINALQSMPSKDGKIPVIIAEFGNSTDGQNVDSDGVQVVAAVMNTAGSQGNGFAAWTWSDLGGTGADTLTANDQLTTMGSQLAAGIKALSLKFP